jgi:hypothetical protein
VRSILTRIRDPQKWLIIRRPKGDHFERIVEIACDMDDADKLFLLASKVYPEALEDIIKAIARVKSD